MNLGIRPSSSMHLVYVMFGGLVSSSKYLTTLYSYDHGIRKVHTDVSSGLLMLFMT